MSLELFNSLATFGTFLVIAGTALAALFQLRHARSANLIEGFSEIQRSFNTPEGLDAQNFVLVDLQSKMRDPEFRFQIAHGNCRTPENQKLIAKIIIIGNLWENLGLLVKRRLIDREMALDMYCASSVRAWNEVLPVCMALRRGRGNMTWENFEYFAVLAQDWLAAHPAGSYPPGVRRFNGIDEFLDADTRYEAQRATS